MAAYDAVYRKAFNCVVDNMHKLDGVLLATHLEKLWDDAQRHLLRHQKEEVSQAVIDCIKEYESTRTIPQLIS